MRRDDFSSGKVYRSFCGDLALRGTASHLEDKYAALAYEAQLAKDEQLAQTYFQHSEHWKKVARKDSDN